MTVRISSPPSAKRGDAIEIKAMIQHEMETGYRRDPYGGTIPRDILKHFECRYGGVVVFSAEFFPGVAANPFLSFYTRATESGTLEFRWTDQHGNLVTKKVALEVE